MRSVSERYSRSRFLVASGVVGTITAGIFVVEKIYLPQSENGFSIPPLVDALIFLVIGLSLSLSMAQFGYRAWSLDLRSFTEWYSCQQLISNQGFLDWYNSFSHWNLRSLYRLVGPIGFLFGIAIASAGLAMIVFPLFAAK